jgi:peptidyl-prolyl cis-trans isomerase B (cyclophilin B)
MSGRRGWSALLLLALVAPGLPELSAQRRTAPRIVVETTIGTFTIETFPSDAPKTVAHIVGLAKMGFYDGQRIHRAIPGFLIQFGDPQTRDPAKREFWGRGPDASSGTPIGVSEISKRRLHQTGAVGVSHMGDPTKADSQIYVTLAPRRDLDGQYAVLGWVVEGDDVPGRLRVGDEIRRVYVRE